MTPAIQEVVLATQTWLRSSWHIQVPFAWLEACVEWLQTEAGGAGHLSQQQINQQALDQWRLTDLRDLDYPVLPEGLTQAHKTELNGTFSIQVDSFLDISQPAYGQLQKLKGTNCANDEVSAVTQATQRSWEARPSRMLLLQLTDGVQSLEAMEYQPIPALSSALRPGVKLQLRGRIVCRLGMLLMGPANVQVLGGEVEDLVDRNNPGRVLCRALGLPEEVQQEVEEDRPANPQGRQESQDLDLDDEELLASLEALEEAEEEMVIGGLGQDSGYGTVSGTSSIRSLVSTASPSRSETSARSYGFGVSQSNGSGSVQSYRHRSVQEDFHHSPSSHLNPHRIQDNMPDEEFPDENFEEILIDELDDVHFQESTNVACSVGSMSQSNNGTTGNPNRLTKPQTLQFEQHTLNNSGSGPDSSNSRSTTQKRADRGRSRGFSEQRAATNLSHELEYVANNESDFMDEDMNCFPGEVQMLKTGEPNQLSFQHGPRGQNIRVKTENSGSSYRLSSDSSACVTPQRQSYTTSSATEDPLSHSGASAVTLTSPPFTYLCMVTERMSKPDFHTTQIRVKAFIVTLLGKLTSNNGFWRICATISDGTGYLDVELSDKVLTCLLGFSVVEKGALKRDPARRGELDAGMRRCQEELVDMCCVMTIVVEPQGGKAVMTKAEPINEKMLQEIEQRVKDCRKINTKVG